MKTEAENATETRSGEGEGEVAVFSAKRWDCRSSSALIESATPCHDAQVVGSFQVLNQLRLHFLASESEAYTTAPQQLLIISGEPEKRSHFLNS